MNQNTSTFQKNVNKINPFKQKSFKTNSNPLHPNKKVKMIQTKKSNSLIKSPIKLQPQAPNPNPNS